MIREPDQIKVNNEQLALLQQLKERNFALKKEIHFDIFSTIVQDLNQLRSVEQNIAIIAGAIASFTIPVINSPLVHVKFLAYLSLVFLFITICYSIYHLSNGISNELNNLSKQHKTFMSLVDENIGRIDKVMETGDFRELLNFNREDFDQKLKQIKVSPKADHSLDWLQGMLFIALLLLTLSFIPSSFYHSLAKVIRNTLFLLKYHH